jgi:hypothetical protein
MTRLATFFSTVGPTRLAATSAKWHIHRSAAGRRKHGQREHDKRAFHLSPLMTSENRKR